MTIDTDGESGHRARMGNSTQQPAKEPEIVRNGRSYVPGGPSGRQVSLPIVHISNGASETEKDVLMRFFEGAELRDGNNYVSEFRDQARGRYAGFSDRVAFDDYRSYEVTAFLWIWKFELGKGEDAIARMFIDQMREVATKNFIELGQYLTNETNPDIAFGGAVVAYRMLGIRLKTAYQRFARFFELQREAQIHGRALTEGDLMGALSRKDAVQRRVREIVDRKR